MGREQGPASGLSAAAGAGERAFLIPALPLLFLRFLDLSLAKQETVSNRGSSDLEAQRPRPRAAAGAAARRRRAREPGLRRPYEVILSHFRRKHR